MLHVVVRFELHFLIVKVHHLRGKLGVFFIFLVELTIKQFFSRLHIELWEASLLGCSGVLLELDLLLFHDLFVLWRNLLLIQVKLQHVFFELIEGLRFELSPV